MIRQCLERFSNHSIKYYILNQMALVKVVRYYSLTHVLMLNVKIATGRDKFNNLIYDFWPFWLISHLVQFFERRTK